MRASPYVSVTADSLFVQRAWQESVYFPYRHRKGRKRHLSLSRSRIGQDMMKVIRYIVAHGVNLSFDSPAKHFGGVNVDHFEAGRQWHRGPLHGGIDWKSKTIFWSEPRLGEYSPFAVDDSVASALHPFALLHELSHVLSSKPPRYTDEYNSSVFAFDMYSIKYLRLRGLSFWKPAYQVADHHLHSVGSYAYESTSRLVDQPTQIQHRLLKLSLAHAVLHGILTPGGKPTFANPHLRQLNP